MMSCSPAQSVSRSNLDVPTRQLNATYENVSHSKDSMQDAVKLTTLFGLDPNIDADSVNVYFDNGKLRLAFKDQFGRKTSMSFQGKFRRKDYQYFLQRKNIVFPPIYWMTNVDRVRVSVAKDSTLIVEDFSDHSGMVLLFGAGYSARIQYKFKYVKPNS